MRGENVINWTGSRLTADLHSGHNGQQSKAVRRQASIWIKQEIKQGEALVDDTLLDSTCQVLAKPNRGVELLQTNSRSRDAAPGRDVSW